MSSELKTRISEDTKTCMRAKDKVRLGVLRLINAAIKQVEVDTRKELEEDGVLGVLEKLADQEAIEIEVTQTYMPEDCRTNGSTR